MTVKWSYEADSKVYCLDFEIEGLKGIFRVANDRGIDAKKLDEILERIHANISFFRYVANRGALHVIQHSCIKHRTGNGWSWKERRQDRLAERFSFDSAWSWFTCPFGEALEPIKSMHALHPGIEARGVKLLHSWASGRMPAFVCYFVPFIIDPDADDEE